MQLEIHAIVHLYRINMELFHIVQEVHYSYGTLACMVHVLKMGYRGRSHDHGMTGHMINKCSLITTESV